jgi:hypothetical protein
MDSRKRERSRSPQEVRKRSSRRDNSREKSVDRGRSYRDVGNDRRHSRERGRDRENNTERTRRKEARGKDKERKDLDPGKNHEADSHWLRNPIVEGGKEIPKDDRGEISRILKAENKMQIEQAPFEDAGGLFFLKLREQWEQHQMHVQSNVANNIRWALAQLPEDLVSTALAGGDLYDRIVQLQSQYRTSLEQQSFSDAKPPTETADISDTKTEKVDEKEGELKQTPIQHLETVLESKADEAEYEELLQVNATEEDDLYGNLDMETGDGDDLYGDLNQSVMQEENDSEISRMKSFSEEGSFHGKSHHTNQGVIGSSFAEASARSESSIENIDRDKIQFKSLLRCLFDSESRFNYALLLHNQSTARLTQLSRAAKGQNASSKFLQHLPELKNALPHIPQSASIHD